MSHHSSFLGLKYRWMFFRTSLILFFSRFQKDQNTCEHHFEITATNRYNVASERRCVICERYEHRALSTQRDAHRTSKWYTPWVKGEHPYATLKRKAALARYRKNNPMQKIDYR